MLVGNDGLDTISRLRHSQLGELKLVFLPCRLAVSVSRTKTVDRTDRAIFNAKLVLDFIRPIRIYDRWKFSQEKRITTEGCCCLVHLSLKSLLKVELILESLLILPLSCQPPPAGYIIFNDVQLDKHIQTKKAQRNKHSHQICVKYFYSA